MDIKKVGVPWKSTSTNMVIFLLEAFDGSVYMAVVRIHGVRLTKLLRDLCYTLRRKRVTKCALRASLLGPAELLPVSQGTWHDNTCI
jgi:hypothetical protein